MNKFRDYGLTIKNSINFPINVQYYKANKKKYFVKKDNYIPRETIMKNVVKDKELLKYENQLFPNITFNI
jgi:hypothetical protein